MTSQANPDVGGTGPFTYDRLLGVVDKYRVIDLFPYKIRNVNNFIHRNHLPYIDGDEECRTYAKETARKAVEGLWVYDEDTWVWMPPKLFFYTNMGTINTAPEGSKTRFDVYPTLRDNEWIASAYVLCCDGFSGFEDDPDFTCDVAIRDKEQGLELSPKAATRIQKTCIRKDGTFKKYVEAWDYLTWFYHHVNPRPYSLGRPLYDNDSYNGLWLASRKYGKTFFLGGGDMAHEYWTNGARYYHELKDRPRVNMMVGAQDSKFIGSFIEAVRLSFTNVPGIGHAPHPYFTRTANNEWNNERKPVKQIGRQDDGTEFGSRSEIGKAVIPPNNPGVVVSTRSKRINVDEIGLLPNAKDVFGAADATLKDDNAKFGSLFGSGTGGVVDKIQETQYLYHNTKEFDIYSIPNYWYDSKDIGLFGPASYTLREYKNENGNTDLIAATKAILADRYKVSGGDITKQTDRRMNEPLEPSEIFLAGKSQLFDKDLVIDRLDVLNSGGEFKKKAKLFDLELGSRITDGEIDMYQVIASDISGNLGDWKQVVTDWRDQATKKGGLLIFEEYMGDGREFLEFNNLYKVWYDPKSDLDTGESFACIKVWKGKPDRALREGEMFNNIVATMKTKSEDAHKYAMMLCIMYKAKMQYERNVSGIPDYFDKYNMRWLLQPTPLRYIRGVTPSSKQRQDTGIVMTNDLKRDGLRLLVKRHKEIVHIDSNHRRFRACEYWYDISTISEMNFYDPKEGNYDDISCMIIGAIWLESEQTPEDSSMYGEDKTSDAEWEGLRNYAYHRLS